MKNIKKTPQPKNQLYIYGYHCIFSAISNPNRVINKIYILKKNQEDLLHYMQKAKRQVGFEVVDNEYLSKLLPEDSHHQGYVASVAPLLYENLNVILHNMEQNNIEKATFLMLDQVSDTRNIGAIIRSAVAFKIDGLIFTNTHFPQQNGQMARASVGGIDKIKLIEVSNLVNAMDLVKQNGFWIAGLDGNANEKLDNLKDFKKIALVLGAEDSGMRDLTKKNCDILTKIPMDVANIDSLNISNAAAIALYEITKSNFK